MYRRMTWVDAQKQEHDFLCCDKKGGSLELYMDGVLMKLSPTENSNTYTFRLPGDMVGKLSFDKTHRDVMMFAIDGNSSQWFYEMSPPNVGAKRSVENMSKLAQFPPIAGLSMKEFYALKSLCTDSVYQGKSIRLPKESIFLNVTGRDCTNLTYDDIIKPGSGFVKVSLNHDTWNYDPMEANIRPGDNVLIYRKDIFGKETFVPIYDVTTAVQFYVQPEAKHLLGEGAQPFVIEGRNAVYITQNISEELEKAKQLMEQIGVTKEDLSQIISSSTTFHEFAAISNMLRGRHEITDYALERLSCGSSVGDVLEQIEERKAQDLDTTEINRGK